MKTLGSILRFGRDGKGFTLREVEEATGVSNAYLSQLENDKIKKPSANVLYKLATLYGMTIEGLLQAAGIVEKPSKVKIPASLLGVVVITKTEEQLLIEYLHFLRYKKHKR
jgi:transcriptional regulator with XRE-family HTH domain